MAKNGNKTTAIVAPAKYAVMEYEPAVLGEIIQTNAGTLGVSERDFERVSFPTGGGKHFTVNGLEGEELTETITGVCIAFRDIRLMWEKNFDEGGGGTPPDCKSEDCIIGQGNPGGECAICPYAAFGSDGRGQKCGQYRTLLMLRPVEILPIIVSLPPTSVGACQKFFMRMSSKRLMYCDAVLKVGLEPATNADGIKYSVASFSVATMLGDNEKTKFRALNATFKAILGQMRIEAPDGLQPVPEEKAFDGVPR